MARTKERPAKVKKTKKPAATPAPGSRGWRGHGRGSAVYVQAADEWRATTVQACGMWPFAAGTGSPMIGVPLGRNLLSGATLCADPISWFQRANLISNPSLFMLSKPGLGKALDTETAIPTPTGWSRMGELQVGDYVFDELGRPTPIVAVSDVMSDRDCYEVRFSDGAAIVADGEHQWVTQTRTDRQRPSMRAYRGQTRRLVGSLVEVEAVRDARTAGGPAITTRRDLARELGWGIGGVGVTRVTRASYRQQPRGRQASGLTYDREQLLVDLERMLTSHWGDHFVVDDGARDPITTRQMAATLRTGPESRLNHSIEVAPSLQLDEAVLPVAPRLLGMWLRNGSSRSACFTSADPELPAEFAAAGYPVRKMDAYYLYSFAEPKSCDARTVLNCLGCGAEIQPGPGRRVFCSLSCGTQGGPTREAQPKRECTGCGRTLHRDSWAEQCRPCRSAKTWVGQLKALGVVGDKHIPAAYLRASTSQRRALLSGLIDTDGTVAAMGNVQYTTTGERLAHDVHELACSLGHRATLTASRAWLYGRDCGPKWTIGFTTRDVVFGLQRKQHAHRERVRDASGIRTRRRYVVDVRPVASRPVRCIQVANDSGMFLAGRSFIATHNSTVIRRMALGLTGYGVMPLILGDLKPDYVPLVRALGGQVIELGRGRGYLNILDPGEATAAAERLTGNARAEVIEDARARRHVMVATLITILRSSPPTDHEEMLLDRAIQVLDDRSTEIPVLRDLIEVLEAAPDEVRHVAMDDGDIGAYRKITRSLVISLKGLLGRGRVGEMFSQETTTPMRRDVPVVFDVSSIPDTETSLQGAALMACWSSGFGALNVANALTDAGLEPQRHAFVILDELWKALRAGQGMVDRVDALTRLNRQRGVGVAMVSHTMSDLEALPNEADRMKARGFVERSGMVICGGLPRAEMPKLTQVVPFSEAEQNMLVGWQDPSAWDPIAGAEAAPPGQGHFLVKVGGRPGIPVHITLTDAELAINDTNQRWHTASRIQKVANDTAEGEAA